VQFAIALSNEFITYILDLVDWLPFSEVLEPMFTRQSAKTDLQNLKIETSHSKLLNLTIRIHELFPCLNLESLQFSKDSLKVLRHGVGPVLTQVQFYWPWKGLIFKKI